MLIFKPKLKNYFFKLENKCILILIVFKIKHPIYMKAIKLLIEVIVVYLINGIFDK